MSIDRPLVDFFLDEESSPMVLCVVHGIDGPDEVEVVLGTFSSKADAMSAVDTARDCLQDQWMEWSNVVEAMDFAQSEVLGCRGNLGLPTPDEVQSEGVAEGEHGDLADKVISSRTFAQQRHRAQRVTLSNEQLRALLRTLSEAPGCRIDQSIAATALGVPLVHLNGALPMAQRLLNVEQFPVLRRDADGFTIVLDIDLLKEQFGVNQ